MLLPNKNPLIYRELRRTFRPIQFWSIIISFGLILLLAFAYLYLNIKDSYKPMSEGDWTELWKSFGYFVLTVQIFVAYYATMAFAFDSVVEEKRQNAYDFFATLPVSPADKMLGLFMGKAMLPALITVFLAPFGILSSLAGGMSAYTLLWIYILTFAAFIAAGTFATAVSPSLGGRKIGWLLSVLLLIATSGFAGIISSSNLTFLPAMAISPYSFLVASVNTDWIYASESYHFYFTDVPWQVCPLVFFIYIAIFSFWAGARRFSKMSPQPMRRGVLIGAFILFNFLLVGFMADTLTSTLQEYRESLFDGYLLSSLSEPASLYMCASFMLVMFWSFASTPNYQNLMQWVEKKSLWPGRIVTQSFSDLRTPAIVPLVLLWATSVGAVITINNCYWEATLANSHIILFGALLLLYLLIYQAAFLLANLLVRRSGPLLGILFLLVMLAIPGLFSSIPELDGLINATPVGTIVEEGTILTGSQSSASKVVFEILGFAVTELAILYILCALRFQALLRISPLRRQVAAAV